ncbi:MAG: glycosyltransferase, partial [Clostridia bacterium]|nr:glycosyltransferase [Clostridia bacterium]
MKQKILLVSKFYYHRGGACIQAMNLRKILEDNGHEVAVFSMQYPKNISSGYDEYFAKEVRFFNGLRDKLGATLRVFGLGDVKIRFKKLLNDFKPDVVHMHNIHSFISPVVAKLAKRMGCKVVWTLHDYKLACPSYACLYNGKPCELCLTDKMGILKTRCMKDSLVASILAYLEARYCNLKKL